jgi:hypothetical protein
VSKRPILSRPKASACPPLMLFPNPDLLAAGFPIPQTFHTHKNSCLTVEQVNSTLQKHLQRVTEGLDSSSSQATAPNKQRDFCLPSPLNVPQETISKQRDHRRLPALEIPQQSNRLPLQLLNPEQESRLPATASQTKDRKSSGEVYESVQVSASHTKSSRKPGLSISDPNFLQLIRSAAYSGTDLVLRGDQTPTSSE